MIELYIKYGPIVVVAILSGIAWLYYRFFADKLKSKRWGHMILRAGQELRAVVIEVNNTYVKALKDAGQDGKWTDVEKALAKATAIDKFKENWGTKGIKRMTKVLGIGGAIDSWLGTQIEATIDDMKVELPQAALPPKE